MKILVLEDNAVTAKAVLAFIKKLGYERLWVKNEGDQSIGAFETEARTHLAAMNELMAPRKNPFAQYTDKLFSEADWIEIAATTDDSLAQEEQLFAAACSAAPASTSAAPCSASPTSPSSTSFSRASRRGS